jgi:hypothetical protein
LPYLGVQTRKHRLRVFFGDGACDVGEFALFFQHTYKMIRAAAFVITAFSRVITNLVYLGFFNRLCKKTFKNVVQLCKTANEHSKTGQFHEHP